MPRVFVATSALAADFDAIIKTGAWPQADYRSTVLLASGGDQSSRRPGKAHILNYGTTQISVEAEAPDGGWLVLTDVWHPWWTATTDGAPANIERADVAFRAVRLTAGTHRVEFKFEPFTSLWRQTLARVARPFRSP